MFRTSRPVVAEGFHDRSAELARLAGVVDALRRGAPEWLALVGTRKMGKTSLLLELSRRSAHPDVIFVVLDVLETVPLSAEVFRRYALRVLDACLGPLVGQSLEAAARDGGAFRRLLRAAAVPPAVVDAVSELPDADADAASIRAWIELPELLARALGRHLVVAIDEFQELAALDSGRGGFDPFALLRSVWQRHERVGYIISGSSRTMITELVTSKRSPFFQHFELMDLGPFGEADAVTLLVDESPPERRIDKSLAKRVVDVVGGHPFYLQLLGKSLIAEPAPLDEESLKAALQDVLFSRTGRLALYFEREYQALVGRSTYLAACLDALAEGPKRLSELAKMMSTATGATASYLDRLGEAVVAEEGRYRLADHTFGLWLAWRRPGGTVVPMTLVGDAAERRLAGELAVMGFELVYQSRGSRGAFDLLALRGAHQLGIQVKRSTLPLTFKLSEWNRMTSDAKRFGWAWIVASVDDDGVHLLDPAKARRQRTVRIDDAAKIENLLAWLERGK